ncbi:MAG TPA: hypothetical protein VD927_09040 [Chryseosolibacter sp.]|nr:hypothetical protein [Chryseosolibacter sp.]
MYLPVESISNSSRIWIYQSDRKLSSAEIHGVSSALKALCESWDVHGQPLPTSFEIRFDQFIILFADETTMQTSGCSIDSSVRGINEIADKYALKLFDRELIGFLNPPADVKLIPMKQLKEFFNSGILNHASLTFNNLIGTKEQLSHSWIMPAEKTWLKRYLSSQAVKS